MYYYAQFRYNSRVFNAGHDFPMDTDFQDVVNYFMRGRDTSFIVGADFNRKVLKNENPDHFLYGMALCSGGLEYEYKKDWFLRYEDAEEYYLALLKRYDDSSILLSEEFQKEYSRRHDKCAYAVESQSSKYFKTYERFKDRASAVSYAADALCKTGDTVRVLEIDNTCLGQEYKPLYTFKKCL